MLELFAGARWLGVFNTGNIVKQQMHRAREPARLLRQHSDSWLMADVIAKLMRAAEAAEAAARATLVSPEERVSTMEILRF